ncbi:phosphoglycerate mutase family protein [Patescibacteria group bacterium]
MNYYIFRHGETFFTKNDLPYGDQAETAQVLEEGIPAIKALAKYLKNKNTNAHFSSPYPRCKQTAGIVEKFIQKKFIYDNRLHDFNAESINNMVNRLKSFYEELKSKNYKNIAICTHGYPIAVLRSLITKDKFTLADLNSYPKPGMLVEIENGKTKLINFN